MDDFKGKVAVITGAASGMGREFATMAASLGMKLVLGDVQRKALENAAEELKDGGADVHRDGVRCPQERARAGAGRFGDGALWRGAPGIQQCGCRRRWPDLGKLGGRLGVGAGREPVRRRSTACACSSP